MTASRSAPFHIASSRNTGSRLPPPTGLDACVARCDGVLRENACAARCLHAAQSAVHSDACAARCAHAASAAPRECVETWVSNNEDAALVASKGCHQSVDAFFHGSQTDTLSVLIHLQKTGGWSVVDAARAAGVRCPSVIANADGRRSTWNGWMRGVQRQRPRTRACAGGAVASRPPQRPPPHVRVAARRTAALARLARVPRHAACFMRDRPTGPSEGAPALQDGDARGAHPRHLFWFTFRRVVEPRNSRDGPLRDCLLCSRRGRASDRTHLGGSTRRNASTCGAASSGTVVGGSGVADNYYSGLCDRVARGAAPSGRSTKRMGTAASRRLDAFDAVLITERLNDARPCSPRNSAGARRGTLPCRGGTRVYRRGGIFRRPRGRRSRRAIIDRAVYARAARAFDASLRKRRPRRRRHDGDVL